MSKGFGRLEVTDSLGGDMKKCLDCGEVTTKKESLCLECRWDQRGITRGKSFDVVKSGSHLERPSFNEPGDSLKTADSQPGTINFDPEVRHLLEMIIDLQHSQTESAKATAKATSGILFFLLVSAAAAFTLWLTIFVIIPTLGS
jgi:hypothetical protein